MPPKMPQRPAHTVGAHCQLGDLRWRVNPSNVVWSYQLDTAVLDTLGGQVVQILGASLSDLTVAGDFGMDHHGSDTSLWRDSWELANAFQRDIKAKMDAQSSLPFSAKKWTDSKKINAESTWVHKPWQFTYSDDYHTWNFKVLVKAITDPDDSEAAITYSNGKFNFRYQLTLFIVQADSDMVQVVATDAFLSRIAKGIGWKKSSFHGPVSAAEVQGLLAANGGSVTAMLASALGGTPMATPSAPAATPPSKSAKPATPKK